MALLPLIIACSDAPTALFSETTEPGRIEVRAVDPEISDGEETELLIRMLDRRGREMTNLPHWALPEWESSDGQIFTIEDGVARTSGPGIATARARLSGKVAETEIRVNTERIEDIELTLDGLYLNQSVQRYDGSVPLVEGRSGVVRAFLQSNYPNRFSPPPARIDLFVDGNLVSSETVAAEIDEIPIRSDESRYAASWNVFVPAEHARAGLSVQIEVDPDVTMPGLGGRPLVFPADGPQRFEFREMPEFRARFIPVHQQGAHLTGRVTEETAPSFMDDFIASFPIGAYSYEIGEPLVTTITGRDEDAWVNILRELTLRRVADGSTRYYYGVLGTLGGAGIAGLAWLQYPAALGVDGMGVHNGARLRSFVYAHEVGHNFGRRHAPCNGPGGIDPNYPYPAGDIGHYGYDPRTQALIPSGYADLMGYCLDSYWVSDYTYENVYWTHHTRGAEWDPDPPFSGVERELETLLVWGGVRNGTPYLEPSFLTTTRPVLPSGRGSAVLTGYSADGSELFRYRFDPLDLGHGDIDHKSFTFALPVAEIALDRLDRLEVRSGDRRTRVRDTMAPARTMDGRRQGEIDPRESEIAPRMDRARGSTRIQWDGTRSVAALVRDPESGTVISVVRGSEITLPGEYDRVDVEFSTGIRSVRMPLSVDR